MAPPLAPLCGVTDVIMGCTVVLVSAYLSFSMCHVHPHTRSRISYLAVLYIKQQ